jgi:hypothetical protein
VIQTLTFWGSQGRVGVIDAGELIGRHIFVYPDTFENWWTMVVEPSPYPDRPGEDYTYGAQQVADLLDPLEISWLPLGEAETKIEHAIFERRPLLGPVSWLKD